jgi:hypothetical protein
MFLLCAWKNDPFLIEGYQGGTKSRTVSDTGKVETDRYFSKGKVENKVLKTELKSRLGQIFKNDH